jgi:RNA polymerase sigma-70 factor (ECF subfamily)
MLDTSQGLLQRLRSDRQGPAWHRLVEVYTPLIRAWLRRYGVAGADADDIVQEVLTTVVQELPAFEHNGHQGAFRAWLRQITVNRVLGHWRGQKRQPPGSLELAIAQLADPGSDLARKWDREHDQHVVSRLLELVEGDFRPATWRAFRLVVLENAQPELVAKELSLSLNAVWSAKSRVLRRLRQEAAGLVE